MLFVIARIEILHCTHHPVIPESDLYFTFCCNFDALSKRISSQLLMDYLIALGNGINPSRLQMGAKLMYVFALSNI